MNNWTERNMNKIDPFTECKLDFADDFKEYLISCDEVWSFGFRTSEKKFYIDLNPEEDEKFLAIFIDKCPYDLSQIKCSIRDKPR